MPLRVDVSVQLDSSPCGTCGTQSGKRTDLLRVILLLYIIALYSEVCKKQTNGLAGSCDADGRKKNT